MTTQKTKTKPKHTRGSWFAEGGTVYGDPGRSGNPFCRPVADVVAQGAETKHNERLLTASPDMLKALREALPFVEAAASGATYSSKTGHARASKRATRALVSMRDALYMATGELPTTEEA